MTPAGKTRRDLVDRLIDGEPADWEHVSATEAPLLDALHTLAQVRSAYQRIGAATAPTAPILFQWGSLSALEKIGSGASAEVYRAWDAGLGTQVALKLLRPEAAAAGLRSEEFLREGRLLARLSQRNVLRVYGAAVHAGRPGIWAEWIDGRTLAEIVEADGAFAAAEAAHIGVELCAALAAIHAAGLIHGDVKASNVLRARGGRIVLTDLGAAGAPDALNASLRTQATPTYLSPQSRDGSPRSRADDLYALGVLLHFLLTGAYPHDGTSRVRALAPETDARIAAAIERSLAADPTRRFDAAHAFADALGDRGTPEPPAAPAPPRTARVLLLVAVLAAIALTTAWWALRPASWQQHGELMRLTATGAAPLRDGATLQLGDRLNLELSSNRPIWAYVLNEDHAGAFHVLFPLAGLEPSNPLSADTKVSLPGRQGGRALSWEVSSNGGSEEFLVILADRPLHALQRRLAAYSVATIDTPQRGVGRIAASPLANLTLRGTHLNALLSESATELADARHVHVLSYHFEALPPR